MQKIDLDSPTYGSVYSKAKELCEALIEPGEPETSLLQTEAILSAAVLFDPELPFPQQSREINENTLQSAFARWRLLSSGREVYFNRIAGAWGIFPDCFLDEPEIHFLQGIQSLTNQYGYKETMISLIQYQFASNWQLEHDPCYWQWSVGLSGVPLTLHQSAVKASLMALDCRSGETIGIRSHSGFSFPLLYEALSEGHPCSFIHLHSGDLIAALHFLADISGRSIDFTQTTTIDKEITEDTGTIIGIGTSLGDRSWTGENSPTLKSWIRHFDSYFMFPRFSTPSEDNTRYAGFAMTLEESSSWIKSTLENITPGKKYCFFINHQFLDSTKSSIISLRKTMVLNQNLKLVIKLPNDAFGGEIQGCLLILDGSQVKDPIFIDASNVLISENNEFGKRFDEEMFRKILEGPEGERKSTGIDFTRWSNEGFSLNVHVHLPSPEIPDLPGTTLCDLAEIVTKASSPFNPDTERFKVIRSQDLKGIDTLTQSSFGDIEITTYDELRDPESMKLVENSAIIIDTELKPNIRAAYFIQSHSDHTQLLVEWPLITLLPNTTKVNPEWLLYALDADWGREHVKRRAIGHPYTSFIRVRDLLTMPILLPSLAEQAIAVDRLKRERFGLLRENDRLEASLLERRECEKLYLRARTHTMAQQFNGLKSDINVLRKALQRHGKLDSSAKPIPRDSTSVDQLVDFIWSKCLELGNGIKNLSQGTLSHPRREFILEEEVHAWISRRNDRGVSIIYRPPRHQPSLNNNRSKPITISSTSPEDLDNILENLVENAIRHGFRNLTKEKKEVIITVFYEYPIDNLPYAVLRVANNGIPLPNSFSLEHFIAPGLATGRTGNSGLGGWIVHELVKEADATLSICDPELLEGNLTTAFEIRFRIH